MFCEKFCKCPSTFGIWTPYFKLLMIVIFSRSTLVKKHFITKLFIYFYISLCRCFTLLNNINFFLIWSFNSLDIHSCLYLYLILIVFIGPLSLKDRTIKSMKFVNDDVAKSIAICFNCYVLQLRYTHVY